MEGEALKVNFVSVTEYSLLIYRVVKHDFMEGKVESVGDIFCLQTTKLDNLLMLSKSKPGAVMTL